MIDGFPDRTRHGYCLYCHQWHDLSAGRRILPPRFGPFGALQQVRAVLTDDASAFKFVCHRCARRRKWTGRIVLVALVLAVAAVLTVQHYRGYL